MRVETLEAEGEAEAELDAVLDPVAELDAVAVAAAEVDGTAVGVVQGLSPGGRVGTAETVTCADIVEDGEPVAVPVGRAEAVGEPHTKLGANVW